MDKLTFSRMVSLLAQEFVDFAPKEEQTDIWWELLRGYSSEQGLYAVRQIIKNGIRSRTPRVSDLLEYIEVDQETAGSVAWSLLLTAIRRVGSWNSVQFPHHPHIHNIVNLWGGWHTVCMLLESDLAYRARSFIKLYAEMVQLAVPPDTGHLGGQLEADAERRGHPRPKINKITAEDGCVTVDGPDGYMTFGRVPLFQRKEQKGGVVYLEEGGGDE